MCVTTAKADLSNTLIYTAQINKKEHVLIYQNTVSNLSFGPNAMILPFDSIDETWNSNNVIDTSNFKNILKNMKESIEMKTLGISRSISKSLNSKFEVFETGIYHVIAVKDFKYVDEALKHIPENKRPTGFDFQTYSKWYPGWKGMICCFDNQDNIEANPLFFRYTPRFHKKLFFPMLDSHDGKIPDLNKNVTRNHVIMTKVLKKGTRNVTYQDIIPNEIKSLLPEFVVGAFIDNNDMTYPISHKDYDYLLKEKVKNKDLYLDLNRANSNNFRMSFQFPPGA